MKPDEIVVVCAEITGLTAISGELTSEKLSVFLKDCYNEIESTIKYYRGRVINYWGDYLLASFDTNVDIELSLEASLKIKERLNSLFRSLNTEIVASLKIGITYGDVVFKQFGDGENIQSMFYGEAKDKAVKLASIAQPGSILVNKDIEEECNKKYCFTKLEPIPVNGGKQFLDAFELGEKKRSKPKVINRPERKIVSEMVGRNSELIQIEGLVSQLLSGKGSIVNIVGEAGIGKSRLIEELKLLPVMKNLLLLEGRAISNGQNLSFHPIINLIKSWAQITNNDIPSVSSKKLYHGIKNNNPEFPDEVFAFMATMMGLPLEGIHKQRVKGVEGEALEKLILKNLRDLIISATKDKPRIYIIEDLHWADSSSITLFESLYKISNDYPVMFINVLRPGYRNTGDYILKYLIDNFPDNYTTINLNPLKETESASLITNLLQYTFLPVDTQKIIIKKTEGNPFFIEEIIRSFIDQGIIKVTDGNYIVTEKIKEVNIPRTINDTILSRVDKLDKKTRELLNTASVMGRNFYYKVLEEATDTIEELDDRLAYLSEVQLINESKKKQEIEYLFKHALSHQLTYDAMMQQSRKELHQKIAKSIEKVFSENINEYYGTLANHYSKAENNEKTVQYMILAGDESSKTGASAEALDFYRNALEIIPDYRKNDSNDTDIRDLEIKIAMAYHSVGINRKAIECFEILMKKYFKVNIPESEKALEIKGLLSIIMIMLIVKNQWLFFKKDPFKDFNLFAKIVNHWGFAILHQNPKHWALKVGIVEVLLSKYNIRKSHWALSVFTDGSAIFNLGGVSLNTAYNILRFVEKAGVDKNPLSMINYLMMKRVHDYYIGNWETNEDIFGVFENGLKVGVPWTTSSHAFYSGACSIELGDNSTFIKIAEKMNDLADSFDYNYTRTLKLRLLLMGFIKFKNYEKVLDTVDKDIAFIKTTDNEAMLINVLFFKAQACSSMGMRDKAKEAILESEKLIHNHKRIPLYFSQYLITKILYRFYEIKSMDQHSRKFQSGVSEIHKLSDKLIKLGRKNVASLTLAFLLKAKVLILENKYNPALKQLKQSIKIGKKYNSRPDLARSYFETGILLNNPIAKHNSLLGNNSEYYLNKAKIMFEEMDMHWDLEQYYSKTNSY